MTDVNLPFQCWRCHGAVSTSYAFCPHCGARLRGIRNPAAPIRARDVAFVRDLYSCSWYSRQVGAIALYEQLAAIEALYDISRTEESRPLIEPLRAQKILRAKLFMEFISAIEAFGILCVAIRRRETQSIIWSFMHTEPQDVSQFFDSVLQSNSEGPLQRLLHLPTARQFNRAAAKLTASPLLGTTYPTEAYSKLAENLRFVAEQYRASDAVNVSTYNKLKHGFVVVEGEGWFTPPLDPEHVHVLVESRFMEDGRIGVSTLRFEQTRLELELTNIRAVTLMGAELLALVIALSDLGLLHERHSDPPGA
jgi:hypothetical protein